MISKNKTVLFQLRAGINFFYMSYLHSCVSFIGQSFNVFTCFHSDNHVLIDFFNIFFMLSFDLCILLFVVISFSYCSVPLSNSLSTLLFQLVSLGKHIIVELLVSRNFLLRMFQLIYCSG